MSQFSLTPFVVKPLQNKRLQRGGGVKKNSEPHGGEN